MRYAQHVALVAARDSVKKILNDPRLQQELRKARDADDLPRIIEIFWGAQGRLRGARKHRRSTQWTPAELKMLHMLHGDYRKTPFAYAAWTDMSRGMH